MPLFTLFALNLSYVATGFVLALYALVTLNVKHAMRTSRGKITVLEIVAECFESAEWVLKGKYEMKRNILQNWVNRVLLLVLDCRGWLQGLEIEKPIMHLLTPWFHFFVCNHLMTFTITLSYFQMNKITEKKDTFWAPSLCIEAWGFGNLQIDLFTPIAVPISSLFFISCDSERSY